MNAQKHLRELLREDQEPFLLPKYISDHRRHNPRRPSTRTDVKAIKKLKSSPQSSSNFAGNFCRSVCFTFPNSPDPRRSPLFDFATSPKSPSRSSNAILLHIPAKTAALLLEAALRIQQKNQSASAIKGKPTKQGLFGSFLKKLTQRSRIKSDRPRKSFRDSDAVPQKRAEKNPSSCGGNGHSRRSSAWWSESNGRRSLDLEASTSGSDADELDDAVSVSDGREHWEFDVLDDQLCKSPFRFALQRSLSAGYRTPDFSPPVASSPIRHGKEETREDYDAESPTKPGGQKEEEDKEQCSPVSVLEPPFEDEVSDDYHDGHEHEHEYEDVDDGLDCYHSSYANVQRAKHQLLEKLYRFEKLAELDPIELEKRMLEQESDDDCGNNGFKLEDETPASVHEEMTAEQFVREVIKLRFGHSRKIPSGVRKLVSDLIAEEWGKHNENEDKERVMKRVCGRLESWKEVDTNTIDMMVDEDFRREVDGWKKLDREQVEEIAFGIEVHIFGSLVREFLDT